MRGLTQAKFLGLLDLRFAGGGLVAGHEIASVLGQWGLDLRHRRARDSLRLRRHQSPRTGARSGWTRGRFCPRCGPRSRCRAPLLAPQHLGGRWLVDGGLTNPVPVSLARAKGAEVIIAVKPQRQNPRAGSGCPRPRATVCGTASPASPARGGCAPNPRATARCDRRGPTVRRRPPST